LPAKQALQAAQAIGLVLQAKQLKRKAPPVAMWPRAPRPTFRLLAPLGLSIPADPAMMGELAQAADWAAISELINQINGDKR